MRSLMWLDALLQPVVLGHQRVAGQYAGDAIALGERQQHGDGLARLAHAIGLETAIWLTTVKMLVFDELDQPFEHLRLAGEMAVQGRPRTPACARPGPRW